jgi:hypothetical protein
MDPGLTESAPFDVCEVGRPSGSVDASRKKTRMNEVEMIGGKGESAIEVIDLVMRCQSDAFQEPCPA